MEAETPGAKTGPEQPMVGVVFDLTGGHRRNLGFHLKGHRESWRDSTLLSEASLSRDSRDAASQLDHELTWEGTSAQRLWTCKGHCHHRYLQSYTVKHSLSGSREHTPPPQRRATWQGQPRQRTLPTCCPPGPGAPRKHCTWLPPRTFRLGWAGLESAVSQNAVSVLNF